MIAVMPWRHAREATCTPATARQNVRRQDFSGMIINVTLRLPALLLILLLVKQCRNVKDQGFFGTMAAAMPNRDAGSTTWVVVKVRMTVLLLEVTGTMAVAMLKPPAQQATCGIVILN
jgi:hypothetical protein